MFGENQYVSTFEAKWLLAGISHYNNLDRKTRVANEQEFQELQTKHGYLYGKHQVAYLALPDVGGKSVAPCS